jgi:hypothetical protein
VAAVAVVLIPLAVAQVVFTLQQALKAAELLPLLLLL